MEADMIWSSILTAALGLMAWTFKSKSEEMQRIQIPLIGLERRWLKNTSLRPRFTLI